MQLNIPTQDAMQATFDAIERDARRTVIVAIKTRARKYIIRPEQLANALGFIPVNYADVLVNAKLKLRALPSTRYFGFGGEVPAINLRAAILFARYARRFEHANREV